MLRIHQRVVCWYGILWHRGDHRTDDHAVDLAQDPAVYAWYATFIPAVAAHPSLSTAALTTAALAIATAALAIATAAIAIATAERYAVRT